MLFRPLSVLCFSLVAAASVAAFVSVVASFAVLMVASLTMSVMTSFAISVVMSAATVASVFAMVSAAASFAAHAVDKALNFFVSSLSRLNDMSFEVECLACQRVVEVHSNLVFAY